MRRLWPLLLLFLAACATLPPPDTAHIYIYRRAIPIGPAPDMNVYDGGRLLGILPDGSYLQYDAAPGPRAFRAVAAGRGSIPYATSLVAGQSYYLMVYITGDQASGDIAIARMDAKIATSQMTSLKAIGQP